MIGCQLGQIVSANPALTNANVRTDIDVIRSNRKRANLKPRAPTFADGVVSIGKVPAQIPVDYRDREIMEVAHQNDRMVQIFAKQYCFTQHLPALEPAFASGEADVTIEHVNDRSRGDLNVYTQAVAWFAARVIAQVVFMTLNNGKRTEHGHSENSC